MKTLTLLALALYTLPALAAPVTATLDPAAGSTEFHAVGRPSMLKITGKGAGPQGEFKADGNKVTGDFLVDLKSLTTGISMRDNHMKEKYLQVDKFPNAELKVTKLELPKAFDGSNTSFKDLDFEGSFKVHGVEKPVKGKADIAVENSKLSGQARFDIKITDYQIDLPKFAGITVAEDVKVVTNGTGTLAKKSESKPQEKKK